MCIIKSIFNKTGHTISKSTLQTNSIIINSMEKDFILGDR